MIFYLQFYLHLHYSWEHAYYCLQMVTLDCCAHIFHINSLIIFCFLEINWIFGYYQKIRDKLWWICGYLNWCNHYGKKGPQKIKNKPKLFSSSTLGLAPRGNEVSVVKTNLSFHVCWRIIHNSQDMKSTQILCLMNKENDIHRQTAEWAQWNTTLSFWRRKYCSLWHYE